MVTRRSCGLAMRLVQTALAGGVAAALVLAFIAGLGSGAAGGDEYSAGRFREAPLSTRYKAAREEMDKGNFRQALQGFLAVRDEAGDACEGAAAVMEAARCHVALYEYDQAVDLLSAFIASSPGTVWEGVALATRGELYLKMPDNCYRKGDRCWFNTDVREGQAEYAWYVKADLAKADRIAARDRLNLSVEESTRAAAAPAVGAACLPGGSIRAEAIANNRALADLFAQFGYQAWDDATDPQEISTVDLSIPFDKVTRQRTQVLYLLDECETIGQGLKDRHPVAEARLQKAMFFASFPENPPKAFVEARNKAYDEWAKAHPDGQPPFKYERWQRPAHLDPVAISASIVQDFPGDPDIDKYEALHGRFLAGDQQYKAAAEKYREFLKKRPKSRWVGDVRSSLDTIVTPTVSLYLPSVAFPGRPVTLSVTGRNVKNARLEFRRLDPKAFLGAQWFLKTGATDLAQQVNGTEGQKFLTDLFGKGEPAETVDIPLDDPGDHTSVTRSQELNPARNGLYVYRLKLPSGEQLGLFTRTEVILVTRSLAGRVSYFAAEAVSGRPVPGARLTVREVYHRQGLLFGFQEVRIHELTTDERGMAEQRFTEGKGISGNQSSAWLVAGDSVALSDYDYPQYVYDSAGESGVDKAFVFTDRPVYRPGDRVSYKMVIREQAQGHYRNVAGRPFHVTVTTPQGNLLAQQRSQADEFGTVHGSLLLPDSAPLGYYYMSVVGGEADDRYVYLSAGANFRVEEYKKPEFKVVVTPSATMAGLSDKVTAQVQALYYFGGPVAGARVTYTVERSPYTHSWRAPDPWSWLYGEGWDGLYPDYYYGGTPVANGEGVTGPDGSFQVELPALTDDELKLENDWRYTVRATVMDLSRRSIEGSGTVVQSRSPFFVHIEQPSGFYLTGDSPEVRVHTMTLDGKGVPGKARWTLARLEYAYGDKEPKRHPAGQGTVDVDERGEADVKLALPMQGHFEMVVTCTDASGREAKGLTGIFVADAKTSRSDVRYAGVSLYPDKRAYKPGEKMRALVVVEKPGFVLVTAEAAGQVLFEQLLEMDTTGRVVEFPVEAKHAPNFFLSAGQVRDHDWYWGQRQIAVPPADKLLAVEILPDRAEHKPGEKGKVKVKVTGPDGKPAAADVALWMFDSSVLYIQPETMGNVAQYYHGQLRYQGMYVKQSGYAYLPYRAFVPVPDLPYQINGLPYVPDFSGGGYGYGALGLDETGGMGWGMGGGGSGPMGRTTTRMYDFDSETVEGAFALPAKGEMDRAKAGDLPAAAPAETTATAQALAVGPIPVREYFPDSVMWVPHLRTGKDGLGEAEVAYPDSLTTWELRAVAADSGELVGQAAGQTVTTRQIVARLEAPRFLVEGDRAWLAGIVRNGTAGEVEARVRLTVEGESIELKSDGSARMTIGPGEEKRVDFEVVASNPGEVSAVLSVDAGDEKDALRRKFPVVAWGARRLEGKSVSVAAGQAGAVSFDLPTEDLRSGEELVVAVDGSLAGVLFAALPYLLDYPYGCVEQTLSRFLPAVHVRGALEAAGVKLDGIPALPDEATLADPLSKRGPWYHNGVFSSSGLDRMLDDGLARLMSMQGGDGGWGWWAGFPSDPYMTAHVLDGLLEARALGITVDENVTYRALAFLEDRLARQEERNLHLDLFHVYVASRLNPQPEERLQRLFEKRNELTDYGRALLALALHQSGRAADADLVLDNLADRAWVDEKTGTASFKDAGSHWWWWWEDREETVAWVLQAFLTIRPADPRVDQFARWLVVNREAGRWASTKQTAAAVRVLAEYLKLRSELATNGEVRVLVNGKERAEWTIAKGQAALFHKSLTLAGSDIGDGPVTVTVEFEGEGRVHSSAFLSYLSKEQPIPAWGNQISIERTYYRLTRKPIEREKEGEAEGDGPQGGPHGWTGYCGWGGDYLGGCGTAMGGPDPGFERQELKDGDPLSPGDLIEVVVRIDSPNDFDYLVFEDPKPAGTEPAELTSGARYENGAWWYREYRDRKVVSFLDRLLQGKQALSYRLIAQIPGTFRVLPHEAHAMYAPRIQAGSKSSSMLIGP